MLRLTGLPPGPTARPISPPSADGSRRRRGTAPRAGEPGIALLEVLIASLVVGIGILGVSLMLIYGPAFTVSAGTSQVQLYMAAQKLERLRVLGFYGMPALGPADVGATAGCGANQEPCYAETIQGGAIADGQPHAFTRLTCVDYVSDDGPPYPKDCPSAPGGSPCWSSASDLSCTKRIRVTVEPLDQAGTARAGPVTLEAILVNPPLATP